ncbi:MAG: 3-methyl-2-oxobutanoate hydroxymethyltransferase [Bacillota bacterium]|jgi:3-methyl-2-oxobutanoate hydroxymethyltransferase
MEKRKVSAQEVRISKGSKRLCMVTAYDYPFALLVDRVDIEMILVGDSLGMVVQGNPDTTPVTVDEIIYHTRAVRRGAPNTMIVADLPFMSYQVSPEEALRNAGRLVKEGGADAVKLEGGQDQAEAVRKITRAGIPVMGHIGLLPQTAQAMGGFRVQGKDVETARGIYHDAVALADAGVFSVVIEAVPAPLGKIITERLPVPTIGIGAGPECDGQVLVIHDLLGLFDRFVPRFVKRYAQLGREAGEALSMFSSEVRNRSFPGSEHSFTGNEEELRRALGC